MATTNPPRLTKHERIVAAQAAAAIIALWDAIKLSVPTVDRARVETHVDELRRMVTT